MQVSYILFMYWNSLFKIPSLSEVLQIIMKITSLLSQEKQFSYVHVIVMPLVSFKKNYEQGIMYPALW